MTMKNFLLAVPVAAIALLSGCDDHKAEVERMNRHSDSLMAVTEMRDSVINDFLTSFNEIEQNLDSIASRQDKIEGTMEQGGQMRGTAKERIREDINAINQLLIENRDKVVELTKKLKRSNSQLAKFQATVARLNNQIAEQDTAMTALNERISGLNMEIVQLHTNIDTLTNVTNVQAGTISDQTNKLHTAYYIVGTPKDLEARQIVYKKGGVLGIGKTANVASTLKGKDFTQIDYTQTTTIPVSGDEVKIATQHPFESYTLEKDANGNVTSLKINNPDEFWSISKYLVVMKD